MSVALEMMAEEPISYPHLEDSALLILLKASDKAAFTEIYARYNERLYTLALRYTKSGEDAKDVLQQVFVKLWNIRQGLSITSNLKGYLYTMTRNQVMNLIRDANSAMMHNYLLVRQRDEAEDIWALAERQDQITEMLDAIDRLPDRQRTVALMRCEGLANSEIARRMDLSLNTVNTHYKLALKALRKSLGLLPLIILLLLW